MGRGSVLARCAVVAVLAVSAGTTSGAVAGGAARNSCAGGQVNAVYAASVRRALAQGRDVWGDKLLHARSGPTYDGVARRLAPLLLAAGPRGRLLTGSGVYYLPFGWPSQYGVQTVALQVADGSGVLANRTNGASLTVSVGSNERFGSCRARLATPRLLDGYLPVLQTSYTDAHGVRYRQESFAAHIPQTRSLVSFVQITADATATSAPGIVRFTPSARGLAASEDGTSLVRGDSTYLFASDGGEFDGSSVDYFIEPGTAATVYAAWLVEPGQSKPVHLDDAVYERARDGLASFWNGLLDGGATYDVPEQVVEDAEKSLLIQNLALGWRYSIGDTYHSKLSTPEAIDAAGVMGEYGFQQNNLAILDASSWRRLGPTANWKMGEQLLGSARYFQLFHDRSYVGTHSPKLARYVSNLGRQVFTSRVRLLHRERYSSDVYTRVYGLHTQAVVWEGLRAMAAVWSQTGYRVLASRARRIADRLGAGLQRAVRRSDRRLHDGTLFVPVSLLDHELPYGHLTASRLGSYWNLVMPYALASGILPPHSRQARGVLAYMLAHGSRILGLVRADAYTLYGRAHFPRSGTDQVYGLNMARFLADNDRPDQLVLSLYGQLAAGMTPGTYISGEAATIAPVRGEYYRRMFLPPNSGSNSAFLETLRLMLVHETRAPGGEANGLELAFATPRSWLRPGEQISVSDAPTSFGRLTYSLAAEDGVVEGTISAPASPALRKLRVRVRLPGGQHLTHVAIDGHAYQRFDPATGTIDLSGGSPSVTLEAWHTG
jgi:hypothetical protein